MRMFTRLPPLFFLVNFLYLSCGITQKVKVHKQIIKCIESEREALLDLKQGLVDDYGFLSSWGSDDQSECCNWWGVHCHNITGHVSVLDLNICLDDVSFQLRSREISPSLLELKHLNYLDLSCIDFQGTHIPKFIASFPSLQVLSLMDANFSGTIPVAFGDMKSLENLNLSGNSFTGGIPKSFGNLTNLRTLCLHSNELNDPIAELFEKLPKGSLQTLDLSGNYFTGSFGQFQECTFVYLDLSNNKITGEFPDLSHCSLLQHLYLSNNSLQKGLPETIGKLSKLQAFDASSNSLEGAVTEAHFSNLTHLLFLDLSFNKALSFNFSGVWIPPFQLTNLHLANCKMGPQFPKWLQTQTTLSALDISSTGISDQVPHEFWNLSSCFKFLNLSYNNIDGRLFDSSPNFSLPKVIDLSYNNFSGPILLFPQEFSILRLSNNKFVGSISFLCSIISPLISFIDLSYNQFSGEIPDCWNNSRNLLILNLRNNSFFGKIPHSLGSLFRLRSLHMGNNNLTGELPSSLRNCTSLKVMCVGGNKLTGIVPSWIGGLKNCLIVSLRHNSFYGNIPSSICHLNSIQILDLSKNKLTGKIPQCFNNFTYLMKDYLRDTHNLHWKYHSPSGASLYYIDNIIIQWKNQEREFLKQLGLLKSIDLSSNQLIGEIPDQFSSLRGLVSLNLSRNNFTGKIFLTIYKMENLESLDLSKNQLSGEIPIGLARLNFLSVLDLSNNFLSSKIPTSTQLQSFNASCYAGNSRLCGDPLPKCPKDFLPQSQNNDYHEDEDDDFLDEGFYISMVLGFSLSFFGIVITLMLKDSWVSAYYGILNDAKDRLYVKMKIYLVKLQQKFKHT